MTIAFEHTIAVNEYGFYCVPTAYQHREIPTLLAAGKVYEPKTLRLIKMWTGTGDVISGGGFIGDFFPAIHAALDRSARLHTFEPVEMSFEAAEETVRLNALDRIDLSPVAVGDAPGELPMVISRPNGEAAAAAVRIVEDTPGDASRYINVQVVTLDALVPPERKISILHLDVEGFERQALHGAVRILNDHKPLVILEGGKPWQRRDFCNILNALTTTDGYQDVGGMENNGFYRYL